MLSELLYFPWPPQGNFAYLSSVDYAIMDDETAGRSLNAFIREGNDTAGVHVRLMRK